MPGSWLFTHGDLPGSFADDGSCSLYDKPLFLGSTAAAAAYKARGNLDVSDDSKSSGGDLTGSH